MLDDRGQKTGYPKDMLDLDLDLEADLGVDTVKQAEMFAAIREIYNIPRDENLKLRDFPTLAHVIRFVYDKRPDLAGPAASAGGASHRSPAPTRRGPAPESTAVAVEAITEDLIKEKSPGDRGRENRLSKDMLDLDLDLEADLGSTRQAGGNVRRHSRDLQHSARREPQAARLPHLGARDPVRV